MQPDPPTTSRRSPWTWVPSLYFAEGVPYVLVMSVSVVMYKRLGISNTDIALYTSWLYLPWVIKPLWSPIVDLMGTKRRWTVLMQGAIGAVLAMVALSIPAPHFFQYTIAFLWLMAFSSATHDIAADGFYMLGLKQHEQAAYAGVRSLFYRIAMIAGEGALVVFAGSLEERFGNLHQAWEVTMLVVAGVMLTIFLYHSVMLPRPIADTSRPRSDRQNLLGEFFRVFAEFFKKDRIAVIVAFLLLYRLAEAQLLKLAYPFLLDDRTVGGLGLDTSQVGYIKGTIGVAALLCGGILGGLAISKQGLRFWLWPMVIAMHLPDLAFVFLAYVKPESHAVISVAVAVEQFGYGFGFTAYTMFMILVSEGEHKTSHYAICTGFMALGMMLPGMFSGWLQDHLGYQHFFLWVMISTIPGFLVAAFVRTPPGFGKKQPAVAPAEPNPE
ncbi:MAG TPA: MFS transporter [Lacipirellulaceae bacterium]|jgi:PAT family beta-lactamase induction signal transducer AmpG|nr:MFS transporter [Lacipirellulaceae bacterium]